MEASTGRGSGNHTQPCGKEAPVLHAGQRVLGFQAAMNHNWRRLGEWKKGAGARIGNDVAKVDSMQGSRGQIKETNGSATAACALWTEERRRGEIETRRPHNCAGIWPPLPEGAIGLAAANQAARHRCWWNAAVFSSKATWGGESYLKTDGNEGNATHIRTDRGQEGK